jgi:hypothetical protein
MSKTKTVWLVLFSTFCLCGAFALLYAHFDFTRIHTAVQPPMKETSLRSDGASPAADQGPATIDVGSYPADKQSE